MAQDDLDLGGSEKPARAGVPTQSEAEMLGRRRHELRREVVGESVCPAEPVGVEFLRVAVDGGVPHPVVRDAEHGAFGDRGAV